MSKNSGKQALREEARRADERRLEQEARKASGIIPEKPEKRHAKQYLLKLPSDEIGRSAKIIERLTMLTGFEQLPGEKISESVFSFIKKNLSFALSYSRCTELWKGVGNEVPGFCSGLILFLEENYKTMDLRITKELAEHLISCKMLSEIYNPLGSRLPDVVGTLLEHCGGRDAITALAEEIAKERPGRGTACLTLRAIVDGEHGVSKNSSWVTEADVRKVCETVAKVLRDPRSDPQTNMWCYAVIHDLGQRTQWVDIVCQILLEPMREASQRGQVDVDWCGDFEDVLFVLSQTKALAKAGIVTPVTEKAPRKDMDDSNEEDWAYFMEQWRRNDSCIRTCHCAVKKPTLYCNYNYRRTLRAEIDSEISAAERSALLEMYDKALGEVNRLLSKIHSYRKNGAGSGKYSEKITARAMILRGECYTALGRPTEALADYMKTCVRAYPPRQFNSKMGKYEAESMYQAIKTLGTLHRYREAFEMLAVLLKPSDAEKAGRIKVDDAVIAWRAKAVELMATLKQAMKARADAKVATPLQPPTITSQGDAESMVADFPIGRCTYSSVGRLEDKSDGVVSETIIIERLQWVILWVRGDILIWDYGKEEVVHWLLLGEGGVDDSMATKFVDLPKNNSALYFRGSKSSGFQLVDLERLSPRGGKTNIDDADLFMKGGPGSFVVHLMKQPVVPHPDQIETWSNIDSRYLADSLHIAVSMNSAGKWRLAVSHESRLVVDVYREDKIFSGTAMGPFFLTTGNGESSCELIGCEGYVHIIEFVGPESPFLVTANMSVIRIWDALSKASTGACVHTIRSEYSHPRPIRSICFSQSMMFTVSQRAYDEREEESSRNIAVWALPAQRPSPGEEESSFKRLATLSHEYLPSSSSSGIVSAEVNIMRASDTSRKEWTTAMTIMEEQYLLVTAHSDGVVNLWQYDDDHVEDAISDPNSEGDIASPVISHLRRLVFWPGSSALAIALLSVPDSLLYVGDMKNLFCLDLIPSDEAEVEDESPVEKFSRVRDSMGVCASMMNCGHCGRYLIDRSSMCSACKRVRFCDRDCQKSGWAAHKALCREEVARQQQEGAKKKG